MTTMAGVFTFIVGAAVGSFLNVCIHRLPRRESIVRPASRCPSCGAAIGWYDNVPILSYVILGGKCRACKARIALRYLLVELITAAAFLGFFLLYGFSAKFAAAVLLVSFLIVATFVDLERQEIPDEVTIGGLAVGLLLSAALPGLMGAQSRAAAIFQSLSGAFVGGGSIYLIGIIGEFIFKKEAMGGGDVKLLAMVGSFLGWKLTILTFFIAPFFGAAVGIVLKVREGRDIIPYGPYLSIGAIVSLLFGNDILRLLFRA